MVKIETPTRIFRNWDAPWPGAKTNRHTCSDESVDNFIKVRYPKWESKFEIEYKKSAKSNCIPFFVEKPALQKIFEVASPEEKEASKGVSDLTTVAITTKLNSIDINMAREIWLRGCNSRHTQDGYRSGTKKFLDHCKTYGIPPLLIGLKGAWEFKICLKANGASETVIRNTIIRCRKFFDWILVNYEITEKQNPFSSKITGLCPPKSREKPLLVPTEEELAKLLIFLKDNNLIVFTAIKLMSKHGMRVGAFVKMVVKDNKAVTITKGGKYKDFPFDEEDLKLWEQCPLNKYTPEQLDSRVNWWLEQAYLKGLVKFKYTAHRFRHFTAVKTLKETGNVYEVQKKLGHKNLGTTGTYLDSLERESL